ncbi:MAG: ABC transporter permease [Acidobacteriota bacterium]|nr:ABC transporter permease [Acidobacteriota bacterium]
MRHLLRRLRYLLQRRRFDADLAEELEFHRTMKERDLLAHGASPDDARFAARRAMGNTTLVREEVQEVWISRWLRELAQDVRFAGRLLAANRGFSVAALLTLGVAIGANTAIFSVVRGVLLQPLPYRDASRLVRLSEIHPGGHPLVQGDVLTSLTYDAWRQAPPRTLDGLAAYASRAYNVTGLGDARRVLATAVSPGLFGMLGVAPAAGRFFRAGDAMSGADTVAVLTYGYAAERFGTPALAIGRTMTLDGRPHRIVGVTPPGFSFPAADRLLFTPFVEPPASGSGPATQVSTFDVVARLAPGAAPAQAGAEGTAIARSLGPPPVGADLLLGKGGPAEVRAVPLKAEVTRAVEPMLWLLSAGVVLVLFIGCANVANLLLSRGVARERELAMRAALGAGRGRVLRQLLTESLVLAVGGIAIGVLLAWELVRAWPALVPASFPRIDNVRLDWSVVLFATLLALLAGAAAGLVPAIHAARTDHQAVLHGGSGILGHASRERLRRLLLAAEAALAVLLLVGSTLLVRSFVHLVETDNGYDARHVLTARLSLQGRAVTPQRWQQVAGSVLDRLRALPGVEAAGATSMPPLGDVAHINGFYLPGHDGPFIAHALGAVVTPGYAEALRFRLRQGRLLSPVDAHAGTQALVVNQAFVDAYLNDGRPVPGRRYEGLLGPHLTAQIVGVVANVLNDGPTTRPQPQFYVAAGNEGRVTEGHEIDLVVRTTGDPTSVVPALRAIVRQVAPDVPLDHVTPLAAELSATVDQPRFVTLALTGFAALALGLAAVGLYGVLSYGVSRRRRELAVRLALGAERRQLAALVIGDGLRVTAVGLVAGLMAAAALARALQGFLFGVSPFDGFSFVTAPLVLLLVASAASLVPAWRAATGNPADALKTE